MARADLDFHCVESFAVNAVDIGLSDESVLINRLDDAENGHRFDFATHHNQNLDWLTRIPARAVEHRATAVGLIVDGRGNLFPVGGEDGKLHRLAVGVGKAVSFCMIADLGVHSINGRKVKVGGPGCVGTIPQYRDKGIGLTMVKNVTQILKEEGYDYSYIHYTSEAAWYEKLGYQTSVKWTGKGIL